MAVQVTIVGGGAAGLAAAYFAARKGADVTVLERTREAGKKILMSGGTRCNVLPMHVEIGSDFSSSARPSAVRAVLNSWPLAACRQWLEEEVGLVLVDDEETSKVFPLSNSAKEVRDQLVAACLRTGSVRFQYNASVEALFREEGGTGWVCRLADGRQHHAERLVLAAGGKSFPAVGTDGTGHRMLAELGIPLVPSYAALTPLVGLHPGQGGPRSPGLAGLSLYNVELSVSGVAGAKKPVRAPRTGFLFTHKGFSGPAVLDLSQHLVTALDTNAPSPPTLRINWTAEPAQLWEERFRLMQVNGKAHVATVLQRAGVRERLADALCAELDLTSRPVSQLKRDERTELISCLTAYQLRVTSHEGYKKAEVTGGGVPLACVSTRTLQVQDMPGLHVAGEVMDVIGRVGGFNFLWAWVTGRLAGLGAAEEGLRSGKQGLS